MNESAKQHLWSPDDAATDIEDDQYLRRPFVESVCGVLDQVAELGSSTVVGLVGPWGSGKSSIMNFVGNELEQARWRKVHFTPWATNSRDGLTVEFYSALSSAYRDQDAASKKARKALKRHGKLMIPLLSAIPYAGGGLRAIADDLTAKPIADEIASLAAELPRDGRSTLVIVDDIDRLQPDELLALFQLVRLSGRLPHVHYLLAYDEQSLIDSLGRTDLAAGKQDRALSYLEKIVQVKLDIPPLTRLQGERELSDGLEAIFDRQGITLDASDVRRFQSLHGTALSASLNQPRKVRRFLVQMAIYLPMVGGTEIDVVDFMALTYIRNEFPTFYRWLHSQLEQIRETPTTQRSSALVDTMNKQLESVSEEYRRGLIATLAELFPQLDETKDPSTIALAEIRQRREGRRVASPEYMDRYFAFGIPSDDLADDLVVRGWRELLAGNDGPDGQQLHAALMSSGANNMGHQEVSAKEQLTKANADRQVRIMRKLQLLADDLESNELHRALEFAIGDWAENLPNASLLGNPAQAHLELLASVVARFATFDSNDLELARLDNLITKRVELLCIACTDALDLSDDPNDALTALVASVAETATRVCVDHLRSGDSAPAETQIPMLVRFAIANGKSRELRSAMKSVLGHDGQKYLDLVARFVQVEREGSGPRLSMTGFDSDGLGKLFDLREIASNLPGEPYTTVLGGTAEVTWQSRRHDGAAGFWLAALDARAVPPLLPPSIARMGGAGAAGRWIDLAPDRTVGSESDLVTRAVVEFPATAVTLVQSAVEPEARRQIIAQTLAKSSLTAWASASAPQFEVSPDSPWLADDSGEGSTSRLSWQTPLGAYARGQCFVDVAVSDSYGLGSSPPIAEADRIRVIVDLGLTTMPSPESPPTLYELANVLSAVMETAAEIASSLCVDLYSQPERGRLASYVFVPSGDLEGVLDLQGLAQDVEAANASVAFAVANFPFEDDIGRPTISNRNGRLLRVAVLQSLLDEADIGGYEPILHQLA